MAFAPGGNLLATGQYNGEVRLWSTESWTPVGRPLDGHEGRILSLDFSPDARTLASASADGTVLLWDVRTGKPVGSALTVNPDTFVSALFTHDGSRLFAVSAGDRAVRFDTSPEAWRSASDFAIEPTRFSNRILGCLRAPDRGGLTDAGWDAAAASAAVAGGEVGVVLGGRFAAADAGGRGAQVGRRRVGRDPAAPARQGCRAGGVLGVQAGRVLSVEQVELEQLRQENERLSEALKELAVELSLVRGRQRSGFSARSLGA